jgi:hypothetical protein
MLGRCRSRLSHFPRTYAEGAGSPQSNPAPPRPDPLRVWARIAPILRRLWRLQTFGCVRGVSAISHIYTPVLQALSGRSRTGCLEGGLQGYRGGAMQDLGYELPRIPILLGTGVKIALAAARFHGLGVARQGPWITWVNKSQRESRGFSPRPQIASAERRI